MMSALKITADSTADCAVARCMMFNALSTGNVPANMAGMIAKYLATSFAIENVVRAPRVISSCFPISTISISLVGSESRSTMLPASRAATVPVFMATPENKLQLIRNEQAKGKLVAMCGDGTNDAPALAQADVGVAMNTGTQAAREAGNMVDLDSDPTKLIEIVEIGKQLLMTRGALTTFSIANDVAKYFAIIPAMFLAFYPQLQALNIMGLHSPQSAILSAIIFNALIIIALIPLALKLSLIH